MKLIFRYLKPYLLFVLLIIGLTYIQVQTELALPDYMSDIVTNGIQYGGIKEDVPKIINESDFDDVLAFLDAKDIDYVNSKYDLYESGKEVEVNNEVITFKENAYVLNDEEDTKLSEVLKTPLVYASLAKNNNLEVTKDNANEVKDKLSDKLAEVMDNEASLARLYIANIYKNVGMNTEVLQTNYIFHVGVIMLGVSFLSIVVTILSTYLSTRISAKIASKMRKDIFEKVESFSSSEFSKFSTASLITRSGNDITKVQMLIQMMMRMMLMSPMMGITAIFKVTRYPSISWILLVAIGIILGAMIIVLIVAVPKFEIIQKFVDKINSVMREALDGILVVRAFNSEKYEEDKFDDVNSKQTKLDRFVSRVVMSIMPVMTFVMNFLTIAIIWIAAPQVDIDVISVGDMMAFIQYAMHVVMSFMFVSVTFFIIPRSLVSARRISEVLDTPLTILDKEDAKDLPEENGDLVFENVSFKYPGAEEYVLKDINFSAKPGETIAFIGSTGSGKSTIVKLIPRLFDVSEGSIKYCGIDIKDVRQKDLHDRIGFISQKAILFTGSIESNIKFGRNVSDEELAKAIEVSQSSNIIEEKENGIKDLISQGGKNVSGGQKQRLSIARALAKKENIYIFDDSFSALDYETDKNLRRALNKLIEETKATVIIVAQRISTIKDADKIIVLEDGKVVGEGKHDDLLRNCVVYNEIAKSQLTKEELANA